MCLWQRRSEAIRAVFGNIIRARAANGRSRGLALQLVQPDQAGMTAPIRTMLELVEAIRAARDERQITHERMDHVAGWPDGYAGKLLAPEPIKNLGWSSFGLGLSALGKMLLMVDDPEQIKRVERQWVPRE